MPDWCDNEVSVSSESLEEMKEFIFFVKSTDNEEAFSFQSILPMPEELKNTISPPTIVSQEEKETSKRYKKKYGHDNWCDWRSSNWGTKWDAVDVEPKMASRMSGLETNLNTERDYEEANDTYWMEYTFRTAWSAPYEIFYALVAKFPNLHISWFYRDDGQRIAGWINE